MVLIRLNETQLRRRPKSLLEASILASARPELSPEGRQSSCSSWATPRRQTGHKISYEPTLTKFSVNYLPKWRWIQSSREILRRNMTCPKVLSPWWDLLCAKLNIAITPKSLQCHCPCCSHEESPTSECIHLLVLGNVTPIASTACLLRKVFNGAKQGIMSEDLVKVTNLSQLSWLPSTCVTWELDETIKIGILWDLSKVSLTTLQGKAGNSPVQLCLRIQHTNQQFRCTLLQHSMHYGFAEKCKKAWKSASGV